MSNWVSVDSELPKPFVPVLCAVNDIVTEWIVILARGGKGGWTEVGSYEYFPCIVTHWMPLPETPKQ